MSRLMEQWYFSLNPLNMLCGEVLEMEVGVARDASLGLPERYQSLATLAVVWEGRHGERQRGTVRYLSFWSRGTSAPQKLPYRPSDWVICH